MPGGFCNENKVTDNKNRTKEHKLKKEVNQYDCKRCEQTKKLKHINKESYPCNECRQNTEIQVTGDNNCYSNLEESEEPWYSRAILSGLSAPPKLKNIFKKRIIQKATIDQCKGNIFYDSCLKDIQHNSSYSKSEEISDPCNPPKKPKSNTGSCKCPPAKGLTSNAKTVKKCIGHSLIEDDNQSRSPRKILKTPAVNNKTPDCKNIPMPRWLSDLSDMYTTNSNNVVEDCQGGAERVVYCTPLNGEELETSTSKSGKVKKPKRKKLIAKKRPRDCDCIEDENNKIEVQKQRKRC